MGSFAYLFVDPLYTGTSAGSADTPWYLPVSIGGHSYLIDVTDYRRSTEPAQRDQVDDGAEPSDRSLNSTGSWKRSQHDWRGGAGQRYYDLAPEDARDRFWSSKGVDVLGRLGAELLPDVEEKTVTVAAHRLLRVDDDLFLWNSSEILKLTDPTQTAPGSTSITPGGTLTNLASDGTYLYGAVGADGVTRGLLADATLAAWSAFTADDVWVANGRLFASDGPQLVEIAADGTTGGAGQLDYTHLAAGFSWQDVASAAGFVVAAGNDVDTGQLYSIGLDDTGGLTVPFPSARLPRGETILCVQPYVNLLLLGTSRGFRLASIGQSGEVQYGPVVEVGPVYDLEGYGEFIYFTWSSYDDDSSGLGKADLSKFTEDLVPAYASDLMAPVVGNVSSVELLDGRAYFTSDSALWGQVDDLVAEGEIVSSDLSFSTFELKAGRYLSVRHDPLAGEVFMSVTSENGTTFNAGVSDVAGSVGPTQSWRFNHQKMERITVNVTLRRSESDATEGPLLRRWTASVIPTPQRVDSFLVPILLFTKTVNNEADGAEHYQDTFAEFNFLKGLEAAKSLVRYQEGDTSYEVYVDGMEMRPAKWNDRRSFFEGVLYVRLLTSNPEG